jgi:EmrB/QacA subfamily drug resistance transporter
VFIVGLGTMVVPFDSSVNVAFPHIVRGFSLSIPAIQWVVIAYTLTYAALTLVFGRVSDIFGYRRIFQIGNVTSAAAFILCSTAPTYGWLLGARVLQGVGAALALSCGPALATNLYPESQRTRVLGLYTMMFGIGSALGPILAGELVRLFDWRAVFWFRAPVALIAFAMTWTLPPGDIKPAQRFDGIGATLLVLAISLLLLALNQVRVLDEAPYRFLLAAAATALCVAGFIIRERAVDHPLLDLRFFRDPDFSLITAAHALLNLSGFSIMLLVPFYLDRLGGLSIPASGLTLASSPAGLMLSGPVAGWLAHRVPAKRLALLGAIVMGCAQIAIGMAGDPANIPALIAAMLSQGFGLGLFQVACLEISTATIPKENRGVAGSLVMMTRTVGVVTGATLLMLCFQTLRAQGLSAGLPDGAAFLAGFQGAFHAASALPVLVILAGLWRGWARAPAEAR